MNKRSYLVQEKRCRRKFREWTEENGHRKEPVTQSRTPPGYVGAKQRTVGPKKPLPNLYSNASATRSVSERTGRKICLIGHADVLDRGHREQLYHRLRERGMLLALAVICCQKVLS